MKQLTLSDVILAFRDEPTAIVDRLQALGLDAKALEGKFSKELLSTQVLGSSFLKFLQDNLEILGVEEAIPAQELPADYKNPFEKSGAKIGDRLIALGLGDEAKELFSKDTLNLEVLGSEFENFIKQNQDKFLGEMEKQAVKGAQNA